MTGDNSAVFEIFTRLNTGQVTLRPQEIRMSLFHSEFFDMLRLLNVVPEWRRLLGKPHADLRMKDIEILLRSFAMLIEGDSYAPSMVRFLNQFSQKSRTNGDAHNNYLEELFKGFLKSAGSLPADIFYSKRTGRFNFALFEAVFAAACARPFRDRTTDIPALAGESIRGLDTDQEFSRASLEGTTQTNNVKTRLMRAKTLIVLN